MTDAMMIELAKQDILQLPSTYVRSLENLVELRV